MGNNKMVIHNGPETITLDGRIYKNFLLGFNLTYNDFLKWVNSMEYIRPEYRSRDYKDNCTAEKEIGWPSFVFNFYNCTDKLKGMFPTEMEFVDYYLKKNESKVGRIINYNKNSDETFEQVLQDFKYRLMRTYPSLLRDIAGVLLLDSLGYKTFYNPEVDVCLGCDCVVVDGNIKYGINMYLNTPRGRAQRNRKLLKFPKELGRIEWPIEPQDEAIENNDFFLYSMKEYATIEDKLKNIKKV